MQRFFIAGERPAQYRFMDEIHSELEGMIAGDVPQVIAELIFLLVAQRRKERDWRGELIIAISLEAGDGERRGAEGKGKCEAKRRVAHLCEMQQARVEHERA